MRMQSQEMCKGLSRLFCCILLTVFPSLWAQDLDFPFPDGPTFPDLPTEIQFPDGSLFPDLGGDDSTYPDMGGGPPLGGMGGPNIGGMFPGAEMDQSPVNITVRQGQTATLPCYVKNLGASMVAWLDPSYRRLSENENIIVNNRNKYRLNNNYEGEYNLEIHKVQERRDKGTYTCMLQSFPPQTKEVTLTVEVPVKINSDSFKEMLIVAENSLVDVICEVEGTGWIAVNWYKFDNVHKNSRELYARGEQLTIPGIQRGMAGIYECETHNRLGNDTKRMRIDVMYPPAVEIFIPDTPPVLDGKVILRCNVTSHPRATVVWRHNTEIIRNSWKYYVTENFSNNNTEVMSVLTITSFEEGDTGRYICRAGNSQGEDEASVILSVKVPTTSTTTTAVLPVDIVVTEKPQTGSSKGGGACVTLAPPLLVLLPIITVLRVIAFS